MNKVMALLSYLSLRVMLKKIAVLYGYQRNKVRLYRLQVAIISISSFFVLFHFSKISSYTHVATTTSQTYARFFHADFYDLAVSNDSDLFPLLYSCADE